MRRANLAQPPVFPLAENDRFSESEASIETQASQSGPARSRQDQAGQLRTNIAGHGRRQLPDRVVLHEASPARLAVPHPNSQPAITSDAIDDGVDPRLDVSLDTRSQPIYASLLARYQRRPLTHANIWQAQSLIRCNGGNQYHVAAFLGASTQGRYPFFSGENDVNAPDASRLRPIEVALKYGTDALETVAYLKNVGADIVLADRDGNTLLHRQIIMADLDGVHVLLHNGANPNMLNLLTQPEVACYAQRPAALRAAMTMPQRVWSIGDNATPLHFAAAFNDDPRYLHALIAYGANIDARNDNYATPLHWAASFSSSVPVIASLTTAGADVDATDGQGSAPLHLAASSTKNIDVIRELLHSGADPDLLDRYGQTAFEIALCKNSPLGSEITLALKDYDANFSLCDGQNNAILHRMVVRGNLAGLNLLLEHGADANALNTGIMPNIANEPHIQEAVQTLNSMALLGWNENDQATPLHLAAALGRDPMLVHALLQRGAEVNIINSNRSTPLHWAAAFSSHPAMVSALIQGGADLEAKELGESTALHMAAACSTAPEIVRALVLAGADIQAVCAEGWSPLHMAAARLTSAEIIVTLLELGADVNDSRANGATPLHHAAAMTINPQVIRLLLMHGADAQLLTSDGNRAIDIAMNRLEEGDQHVGPIIEALRAPATNQVDGATARSMQNRAQNGRHDEFRANLGVQAGVAHSGNSRPSIRTVSSGIEELAAMIAECRKTALVRSVDRWYEADTIANSGSILSRVQAWQAISSQTNAFHFSSFLRQLRETADCRNPYRRPALIDRTVVLLEALREDPQLRESCFFLAEDITNTCGDGIALTLNRMDSARINRSAEQGKLGMGDLIDIRSGLFKLEILQQIAQEKIASLNHFPDRQADAAQVILAFQTHLARRLNLPGVSQTMLYTDAAQVTPGELDDAVEKVSSMENRKQHVEFIANWEPWQNGLRRNYPEKFAQLARQVEAEQDDLVLPPEGYSDFDYMQECDELKAMQASREKLLCIALTRKCLEKHRESREQG